MCLCVFVLECVFKCAGGYVYIFMCVWVPAVMCCHMQSVLVWFFSMCVLWLLDALAISCFQQILTNAMKSKVNWPVNLKSFGRFGCGRMKITSCSKLPRNIVSCMIMIWLWFIDLLRKSAFCLLDR